MRMMLDICRWVSLLRQKHAPVRDVRKVGFVLVNADDAYDSGLLFKQRLCQRIPDDVWCGSPDVI